MWPIGHAAGAYLIYAAWGHSRGEVPPDGSAVLILVVASLLPDLVDKPLSWYLGVLPTGRSLTHSLLVVLPLCLAIGVLAARYDRTEWGIAFGCGALSHLLFDALPALWRPDAVLGFLFYPLIPVEPYEEGAPTLVGLLVNSIDDPYFYTEFVLLALAVVVWRRHGYPGIDRLIGAVDHLAGTTRM